MMQKLVKFNIYLIKNAFSKLAVNKRDYLSLVSVKVIPSCPTLCDPMDYIQSIEISRPEYWSG